MTDEKAKNLLKRGYSPAAVAMCFGAVGTTEYYDALEKYGGDTSGKCPYCGVICMGTGDCNCQEK